MMKLNAKYIRTAKKAFQSVSKIWFAISMIAIILVSISAYALAETGESGNERAVTYKEVVESGIRYEYYDNPDGTVTITNITKPLSVPVPDGKYGHNSTQTLTDVRVSGLITSMKNVQYNAVNSGIVTIPSKVAGKTVVSIDGTTKATSNKVTDNMLGHRVETHYSDGMNDIYLQLFGTDFEKFKSSSGTFPMGGKYMYAYSGVSGLNLRPKIAASTTYSSDGSISTSEQQRLDAAATAFLTDAPLFLSSSYNMALSVAETKVNCMAASRDYYTVALHKYRLQSGAATYYESTAHVARFGYVQDNAANTVSKIVIPATVTTIGSNAFKGITAPIEFAAPQNIRTIGANAFEGCTGLGSVDFSGVTSIGANAFKGCTNFSTTLPTGNYVRVGTGAFNSVKKVVIEDDAKVTYDNAACFSNTNVYLLMPQMKTTSLLTNVFQGARVFAIEKSSTWNNINGAASLSALPITVTGASFSGIVMSEQAIPTNLISVSFKLQDYNKNFVKTLLDLGGSVTPNSFPTSGDGQRAYIIYNGKTYTEFPLVINVQASYSEATYYIVQGQLAAAQSELLETKQELLDLKNQIKLLQDSLGESGGSIGDIQDSISRIKAELATKNQQLAQAEAEIELKQKTIDSLTEALEQAKADMAAKDAEMVKQKEEYEALIKQMEEEWNTLSEEQKAEYESKITAWEEKYEKYVQEQNEKYGALLDQANTLKNDLATTTTELTSIRNFLASLKELLGLGEDASDMDIYLAVQELKNQIAILEKTLSGTEEQLDKMKDEMNQIKEDLGLSDSADLEAILKKIEEQYADIEAKRQLLLEIVNSLKDQGFNGDINTVKEQVEAIRNELNSKIEEIAELNKEILNIRLQLGLDSGATNKEILDAIIKLQDNLASSQTEVSNYANQMNKLIMQLALNNGTDFEGILAAIVDLQTKLNDATQEAEEQSQQLRSEIINLQNNNESLQNTVNSLTMTVASKESELALLREQIAALQGDKTYLQGENTYLQGENTTLLNGFGKLDDYAAAQEAEKFQMLQDQIIALEGDKTYLQEENMGLIDGLNNLNSLTSKETTEKITMLQEQLTKLQEDKTYLQNENTVLQSEKTTLTDDLDELKITSSTIKEDVNVQILEIKESLDVLLLQEQERDENSSLLETSTDHKNTDVKEDGQETAGSKVSSRKTIAQKATIVGIFIVIIIVGTALGILVYWLIKKKNYRY